MQGASKQQEKALILRLFCLFKTSGFVPPLLYKLENIPILSFRDYNTII